MRSGRPRGEGRGRARQSPSSTATIPADADRLQQIVWNLLSNAIKFTPAGGFVELRAQQSAQTTEIIVSDSGIGMASDVIPFVFDRFRQADSSTTRRHGGVGLGLAIVRHLVELHGGSVSAASAGPDMGATFTVRLPAASPAQPAVAVPSSPSLPSTVDDLPMLTNVRVVLVDDDADTREVLTTVLSEVGAEVIAIESTAQALTDIEATPSGRHHRGHRHAGRRRVHLHSESEADRRRSRRAGAGDRLDGVRTERRPRNVRSPPAINCI